MSLSTLGHLAVARHIPPTFPAHAYLRKEPFRRLGVQHTITIGGVPYRDGNIR